MGTHRKRNLKPGIFLAVMMLHGMALVFLVRATEGLRTPYRGDDEPLTLLLLRKPDPVFAPTAAPASSTYTQARRRETPQRLPSKSTAITPPSGAPAASGIDWQREAELAAQNGIEGAVKGHSYRNLAGLSEAQLKFVRDNQMVQMAPGIVWAHPVVEVDKATLLPIIHINDHCVLILLFPYCSIGHIEPNGHLLDHMRDPAAR